MCGRAPPSRSTGTSPVTYRARSVRSTSRSRSCRWVRRTATPDAGGRRLDAAFRRPPAPAPGPDPPRGLAPRLRLDQSAAGYARAVAARRARDARADQAGEPPVRARPADLRAVLALRRPDGALQARNEHLDVADGRVRDPQSLSGDGRAGGGGDALRGRARDSARVHGGEALRNV